METEPRIPRWMWPAAAFAALYAVYCAVTRERPTLVEGVAIEVKLLIEAVVYASVYRRADLPLPLRRSFGLLVGTTVLGACSMVLYVASDLGFVAPDARVTITLATVNYLVAAGALVNLPRARLRPGQWRTVSIDLLLVTGTLGILQWQGILASSSVGTRDWVLVVVYAFAQVAMMAGLSIVVDLGQALPSERAFWWFVMAMGAYVPISQLAQLSAVYAQPWAMSASRSLYFATTVMVLVAGVCFRGDPLESGERRDWGKSLVGLNPLSLGMPLVLGTTLVMAIAAKSESFILPLGVALVVATGLLVVRLALTARENVRLLLEEREAENRLQVARSEERGRLMADLHDGFGSQLVSAHMRAAAGTLPPAETATLLKECLADLHLVIDTLRTEDGNLAHALGDYRHRLASRLAGSGVTLQWRVQLQQAPTLPSGTILQVLRVVQEALNNALKHAQAKVLTVEVTCPPGGPLQVAVSDDGVGVPENAEGGKGLTFMKSRSQSLGATLEVRRREDGPGTTVTLTAPLPPPGVDRVA
jgi:signal transduction histidine kinase